MKIKITVELDAFLEQQQILIYQSARKSSILFAISNWSNEFLQRVPVEELFESFSQHTYFKAFRVIFDLCSRIVSLRLHDTKTSGTSRSHYAKCTSNTTTRRQQLLRLLPVTEMPAFTLTDVSNAYSADTAIEILNTLQHACFSLELFNSTLASLNECEVVSECIANVCTGRPTQSTKQFSH